MNVDAQQVARLQAAEDLEKSAATDRVRYYRAFLPAGETRELRLLDLGCGNGYAVHVWRDTGVRAFGVDLSMYRFSRWISEDHGPRRFVLADARRLPFRAGAFGAVVSSGMIEHVGVAEFRPPYRVHELPEKDSQRSRVVQEALRVLESTGSFYLDFPNGGFPVDFWHGDETGSFRIHATPDSLLPTYSDLVSWLPGPTTDLLLLPIRDRLQFRQIASRWWGRVFRLPMQLFLRALDSIPRPAFDCALARLYPFLAFRIRTRVAASAETHARTPL